MVAKQKQKYMDKFIKTIKKAGWDKPRNGFSDMWILLDRDAWIACGKAEGWEEIEGNGVYPVYRDKWHQLIDHLVKGKDINSFFDNLLK